MKKIALLPCKNEIHLLPTYLNGLKNIADLLIVVDDNSTDGSLQFLQSQNIVPCQIHSSKNERNEDWSVDKIRQQLLELGRKEKGTHFICLDADECLTNNFKLKSDKIFAKMNPGQKIKLQWLAMWKSTTHYREDDSIWSNNFKDFIYCDNLKDNFNIEAYLCEPRTPGNNNENNLLTLNVKHGAVMHFQFSNWEKFQIKQCWYRCKEKTFGKSDAAINQKFSITLDSDNVFVKACPDEWIPNILPNIENKETIENNWHLQEIKNMFNKHGVDFFKNLQIWHVKEIKNMIK